MKKKSLLFGLLLFFFSALTHAYTHPIDGVYYGFIVGGQYLTDFKNVAIPPITGVTTTTQEGTYRNAIGVGFDLHAGYRFMERIRVEGELFYGTQKINSIGTNNGTVIAPTGTATTGRKVSGETQSWGGMINAFFDFFKHDPYSDSTFTPYIGGGIGTAQFTTGAKIVQKVADGSQGPTIADINKGQQFVSAYQGIMGFGWLPDDFTFVGIDFRYQGFGKVSAINTKPATYGVYLVMNFSMG